ncbi:MAG: hypothetical protein KY432_01920 [Acidobacteria bacterium]|nr:hypothetical protein [Acidobacteriota bacterium]
MKSSDPTYVAAALDPLFALPIDFQPDIDEALGLVDPNAARSYLLDRLEKDYQRGDCAVLQEIFDRIGAEAVEDELARLFSDENAHVGARACALQILCGRDGEKREGLLAKLDQSSREAVVDEPLRELIADAIEDANAALAIAYIAEHFPESRQLPLEQHIELIRKKMGATAATVYEPLLCSMKLRSLHDAMIEALIEEAAPDARHALECAAESADDDAIREKFEKALERLDERETARPVVSSARLGPIDGPGRYEVAIIVENPEGTKTLAFLLIDNEEILDGFVDFDPPADLFSSNHLPRVEISAAQAAAIAATALKRTLRDTLDPYTRAAVRYFERLPEAKPLASPKPAEEADGNLVAGLMDRPEYLLWAFAPEDFHQCDIPEPPENPDDEWVSEAMKCLDQSEIRSQIRSDVEYMSRWHLAAGETREAAGLARIATELEDDFSSHPLIRAMVERSVEILHHPDLPDLDVDDDDELVALDQIHDPEVIRRELLIEIIDKQIRGEDPQAAPEVYKALRANGLSEREAKEKMAEVLNADLQQVIEKERPHDPADYQSALRRLT